MPQQLRTYHYLTIAAVIAWSLYLLVEYLSFHGRMLGDFFTLPYAGLVGFYLVLAGVSSFFAYRRLRAEPERPRVFSVRGIGAYGLVLLTGALAIAAFASADRMPEGNLVSRLFYFAGYSSLHVGGLFLLAASAHGIGKALLANLSSRWESGSSLVSIGLGTSVLGVLFSIIGLINLLVPVVCWIVILLGLGVGYKSVVPFVLDTLWTKKSIPLTKGWVPAVLVALVAVMGINLVGAFKTFPIGFDGAALYLNTAMLTADSGGLPYGGQAFGWSVMMALGEILFGSLPMGILLSHAMVVPCVLILYRIARLWLTPAFSLLASLITLSAPFVVFHSLVDEKVDLAFSFISLCALYLAIRTTRVNGAQAKETNQAAAVVTGPSEGHVISQSGKAPATRAWLLIGLLVGFAFTIKYTAIIFVLALGCYWLYQRAGKYAFTGGALAGVGLLFASGVYRLGYIDMPRPESLAFGGATLLLGLALVAFSFRRRVNSGLLLVKGLGLFLATFLLAFAPWALKNVSENGSFSVNHVIQGESVAPPLEYIHQLSLQPSWGQSEFFFTDYRSNSTGPQAHFTDFQPGPDARPDSQPADGQSTAAQPLGEDITFEINQGAREDVQRYMGYEAPFLRYLTLPYDMTVNANLSSRLIDIGFLGLLFLPFIFFFSPREGRVNWLKLLLLVPIFLYLAGVAYSLYAADGVVVDGPARLELVKRFITTRVPTYVRTADAYLITPALSLAAAFSGVFAVLGKLPLSVVMTTIIAVTLALTLGPKSRLATLPHGYREFGAFLSAYALLFWIMGNGVIWYAMPLFLLAPIFLLWFFDRPERLLGPALAPFTGVYGAVTIGLMVLFQFGLYFTSPFEGEGDPGGLFRYPFVEMATKADVNERKVQTMFNPASNEILDALNQNMDDKIYRVATQLGPFIRRNDRRVFSDPVLTKYDDIASRLREGEEERFFDMLKAQGYKYILFDLRLGAVDRTPEQTLKKKFLSLANAMFTTRKLRYVSTDNYVADPKAPVIQLPNGKRANARRGLDGKTILQGSVLLMEIR